MDRYKDCTFAQTNLVRAEVTIPLAWVCSCNHRLPELSQKTLLRAVPIGRMERDPGRAGRSRALIAGSELRPN
jgi:hypothetical protein